MNFRTATTRAILLGASVLFAAACGEDQQQIPTETEAPIEQVGAPGSDISTALAVKARLTPGLMKKQGVVGTGLAVNGDRPTIRVYTVNGNVRGIPDHVEGIPVERIVTGLITAGDANDPRTSERPAPNGFSIGHPDITAGTFGALVQTADGMCHALSNNHVLANSNDANIGDVALQPGPYDGGSDPADAIGTLSVFVPISFSSDNEMDAALAVFDDAADAVGATPAPPVAYGPPTSNDVGPFVGQSVQKFGRTTGHTTGTVTEIAVEVSVCYVTRGPWCRAAATFVNQFAVSDGSFSAGGDSGSLIVDGSRNPVGLLFAGSDTRTIASPIGPVLSTLGASIQTNPENCSNHDGSGEPPANDPPDASFTYEATGLTVDFTDQSSDSDGNIASWDWDFGDGSGSSAENPSHTYDAGGTYSVTLTVTDDDDATGSFSAEVAVTEPPSGGFTLSTSGYKERGRHTIDLAWSGASSTDVDIHRNGSLLTTTANDGEHTDSTNNRGGGSYTYEVCEAGTSTCSNPSTVNF